MLLSVSVTITLSHSVVMPAPSFLAWGGASVGEYSQADVQILKHDKDVQ